MMAAASQAYYRACEEFDRDARLGDALNVANIKVKVVSHDCHVNCADYRQLRFIPRPH
jgi:hypothetical protein